MIGEFGVNAGYVEELHARFRESPQNVDPEWRAFFEGVEEGAPVVAVTEAPRLPPSAPAATKGTNGANGTSGANGSHAPQGTGRAVADAYASGHAAGHVSARADQVLEAGLMQGRVYQLLNAYRVRGHLFATLDPLGTPREAAPELDLENFGLSEADLDTVFPTVGIGGLRDKATLRQIVDHLAETYCRSIGVEFTHIEDPRDARLAAGRAWSRRATAPQLDESEVAPHPHEADRRRDLRAVHPQELRRRQALLARGGREHDPDARPAHRVRRRARRRTRSSSAWRTAGA